MVSVRNVDVRNELERYDWQSARWTDTKLIASSPFRYDVNPSFFVNLDETSEYYGCWGDSGAIDDEWRSGGFVRLLSFLRNETTEETADYLLLMYGPVYTEGDKLPPLRLPVKRPRGALDEGILKPYMFRHKYLERRGISEVVQRLMGVGYDQQSRAITMPWRTSEGALANVKYRKTDSKIFWYEKGGWPVRDLVYGMDVVYRRMLREAVICEAEIDAMSFMTAGVPAVALGHGAISRRQVDIIRQSPLETVYICTDNDSVGEGLRANVQKLLSGYKQVKHVNIPKPYKDANEAHNNAVGLADLKTFFKETSEKMPVNLKIPVVYVGQDFGDGGIM